uniref:uncharacterized protein LOC120826144 isoform X2 n=1 Tax=Gasterosteus aculeatus aculeatus TaxID=481459 RepID=UPI001A994D30|nr:uncharacterized protein LOC120826144 isoform X2 [Gasterosteus aculeatus aculeatus]
MMPWGRSRIATATPKHLVGAFAPFPRSTWIHADVPRDNYDRICEKIWRAANEAEEEFGRGASPPERQRDEEGRRVDDTPTHRAKEQQKEADDFGLSTRYEEDAQRHHTAFALPCPRLSGHRPPPVAEPARELKPVMEKEMKRAREARGNAGLSRREEEAGDGQTSVSNDVKGIIVPESTGRENSSEPQPQPPAPDPVCSATADRTLRLEDDEDPQHAACESRDGENTTSSCDSDSSDDDDDDDFVSLPGARSYATDNSRGESESENDSDGEISEMLRSLEGACSNSEQDSLCSFTAEDFPLLSATKAGNPPRPTEPPAWGKMKSHWEIPLSAWPCDFPAATLASCVTGRAHAPVRGKAGAPEASSLSNAPAAPEEQPYNLLADFPALQPSKKPLALGVWRDGNPETKVAEGNRGHARTKIQCQGRGGSCRRKIQIVPLEVPSVCTRDQKSVGNSPTVSGEELKASNQPTPRVCSVITQPCGFSGTESIPRGGAAQRIPLLGTDGVDTNARSWASVAKMGLE